MLFGMTWWASLFVLLALLALIMDLSGLYSDDDGEGEKPLDFLLYCARQLYYVAVIMVAILMFQNEDTVDVNSLGMLAAIYSIPFGLWYIIRELFEFIKNPAGEPDDTGEQAGVLFNAMGYALSIGFFVAGLAIALTATNSLWQGYI